MKTIRLICRNSRLSVIQAEEIITSLPAQKFGIIPISSYGDKHKEISLLENTEADFFTRELDQALLKGVADIAVHSAKDLPYPLPEGIELLALTKARYTHDVFISRDRLKLDQFPSGAKIGTSSESRRNQVLARRPDLKTVSIRGTIEERIELIKKGEIDALIVAGCALKRLELDYLTAEVLPFETHPLQGSLAITAKTGNTQLKSIFHAIDERKNYGKVFLTGSGPGSSDLLTIRAWNVLKNADIIFYDALIDNSVLNRLTCRKVYTGKRKGLHSYDQDEINRLMYQAAIFGKQVVRLKGGDPQIFGRGAEEFDYLRSRFIDVEIIPGITSALAAAALTGIPLTHRNAASSVAFCTGFPVERIKVPDADTLVYYMGATNLMLIAEKVIRSGKPENTPVALISNISSPLQRTEYKTLGKLLQDEIKMPSPLLIIIGETARSKNFINEASRQPRIMVTGTNAEKYRYLGQVIHQPIIDIQPVDDDESVREVLTAKNDFDWILFTSRHAVKYFFQAMVNQEIDIRWIANSKIISIGSATTRELRRYGFISDVESEKESSSGIINLFIERGFSGRKILIPRSALASESLPKTIKNLGYQVTTLTVYRNIMPENYQKTDLKDIDLIVFSSPSCVKNFKETYRHLPEHIGVITQGEKTELALYHNGLKEFNDWVI